MQNSKPLFRIDFLDGHNKSPIVDTKNEFTSFRDFVSAHSRCLSFADLKWKDLKGCDLSEGDLRGADLSFSKLDFAVFNNSRLDGANLNHTSATNIEASNVSAQKIRAEFADISNSKLSDWQAEGGAFASLTMDGTKISGSNFRGSDFSEAHGVAPLIANADFRNCSFRDAFIASPTLRGCHFSHNSARSAIEWNNARMPGASIEGSIGSLPVTITLESRISKLASATASASLLGLGSTIFAAANALPPLSGLAAPLYGTAAVIAASGVGSVVAIRSSDSIWNRASRKFGGLLGKTARKVVSATKALAERLGISENSSAKALNRFQTTLDETYVCLGNEQSTEALKSAFHALYIGRKDGIAQDMISTFGPSSELLVCNRGDVQKLEFAFSRMSLGHETGSIVVVDPHAVVSADGQTPAVIANGKVFTDVCFIEKRNDGNKICLVAEYKKDGRLFGLTRTEDGITTRYKPTDPETAALRVPSLRDAIFSMERNGLAATIEVDSATHTNHVDANLADRNDCEHPSGIAAPA